MRSHHEKSNKRAFEGRLKLLSIWTLFLYKTPKHHLDILLTQITNKIYNFFRKVICVLRSDIEKQKYVSKLKFQYINSVEKSAKNVETYLKWIKKILSISKYSIQF